MLPLSLVAKPVDSNIRKGSKKHMPFPLSHWKLINHFFQQSNFFSVCEVYWQSIFDCQRCRIHMQGDVAHNTYSIAAIYQRIFNQLIQILHWMVDIDLFWAFWRKPRDSTANVNFSSVVCFFCADRQTCRARTDAGKNNIWLAHR